MRDEQVRRYSRHIMLPDIGGLGQTAIMVSSAKLVLRESEPTAEIVAGSYLAAGGIGKLVVPQSSDQQRATIASRGPDTQVVAEGDGREVALAPRPSWWPSTEGDAVALAYYRGSVAAAAFLSDVVSRT